MRGPRLCAGGRCCCGHRRLDRREALPRVVNFQADLAQTTQAERRHGLTQFGPAEMLQPLEERRDASLSFHIVRGRSHEHADPLYLLWLLRKRGYRQSGRRAAEQRDELAAGATSITSSARASNVGGISMPSARAVCRLMISSNRIGSSIGRSAGFTPLKNLVNVTGCSTISVSDACPVADQSSIIGIFAVPVNRREAQLRSSIDDDFPVGEHKRIVQKDKNVRSRSRNISQPVPQFIEVTSIMKRDGDIICCCEFLSDRPLKLGIGTSRIP